MPIATFVVNTLLLGVNLNMAIFLFRLDLKAIPALFILNAIVNIVLVLRAFRSKVVS